MTAHHLPLSGVPGLTPRQVRDAMAANGWPGIPIHEHDAPGKSAGKRTTIQKWQGFAAFDARLPTSDERAGWSRSPSLQGAGTGVPCGSIIGADIDVGDPVTAATIEAMAFAELGATPFIRQGRAPRSMLVFRAAEPIAKQALKANDDSGDGIDIMGVGSHSSRSACIRARAALIAGLATRTL